MRNRLPLCALLSGLALAAALAAEEGARPASGTTHGVYGTSHSPDGAGVGAENTDPAGADLLLAGTPPAKLTEAGLSRGTGSNVIFDFSNPGAGAMTLQVDGNPVWHAGSDGSGSGLDADLLDGIDSTGFLLAATDLWVNVTGDTMSSSLTLDPAAGNALTTGAGDDIDLGGRVKKSGTLFLHGDGASNTGVGLGAADGLTTGSSNTAVGDQALTAATAGSSNTALGRDALLSNTSGGANVAIGVNALRSNLEYGGNVAVGADALYSVNGSGNVAVGTLALRSQTSGGSNTAVGFWAMRYGGTGSQNTAVGSNALEKTSGGHDNTGVGKSALAFNVSGSSNIALGIGAAVNTTGDDNIAIGNVGVGSESGAIRIGTTGTHTKAFLAGVSGVTPAGAATSVVVDAAGQLGTASGSGSGIDADLLDALDSAAFLKLAGGTMAGAIDLANSNIVNIGDPSTDFTGGGLTLSGTLGALGSTTLGDAAGDTATVNATLRFVPRTAAPVCDASTAGRVYFDSDDDTFCFCEVSGWRPLDGTGACS